MSGASMNEIKARMKSIKSTMQITKAMELVATSKLRRARQNADNAAEYCRVLDKAVAPLISSPEARENALWFCEGEGKDVLYIVIAGDRGLAGGYNSNVLKQSGAGKENAVFLPMGKKALEFFDHRGCEIFSRRCDVVADLSVGNCFEAARAVCRDFANGRFSRVELIYTEFVSMLSQCVKRRTLLPLAAQESAAETDVLLEGDVAAMLDAAVPNYVGGVLYFAVCQAVAAESAARRTAMDSANKNASEMIDTLTLSFNRARQAVITQEITEIVSGAEAL